MATKMVAFCHLAMSRNSIHKNTEQNWSQREEKNSTLLSLHLSQVQGNENSYHEC